MTKPKTSVAAPKTKGTKAASAAKKADPPGEAPNGKLTIIAWSAFTRDGVLDKNGRPKPHWGDGVTKDNVIVGATVSVVGEGLVSKGTDKNQSATTLDLNRLLDGTYTLRFEPIAEQLAKRPAGPQLQPNVKAPNRGAPAPRPGALPDWVDRMYRTIDLRIVWRGGALAQAPTVVDGFDRCRVIRFSPNLLEIDWKPDWVRAKNIARREPPKSLRETPPGKALPQTRIDAVVLHRTGAPTIGSSLSKFMTTILCSHYLVDIDGFIVKLVPDAYRGAHAGSGAVWDKEYVVNDFSIGIELVNETGTFPSPQMLALADLLVRVKAEHGIRPDRVLGHCEVEKLEKGDGGLVTNNRNDCPGKEFDWPLLERKGLAMAPLSRLPPHRIFRDNRGASLVFKNADKTRTYGSGEVAHPEHYSGVIATIQNDLAAIGYEEEPLPSERKALDAADHKVFPKRGEYDRVMELTVQRFQRRYMGDTRNVTMKDGRINRATSEMILAVRYAKTRTP